MCHVQPNQKHCARSKPSSQYDAFHVDAFSAPWVRLMVMLRFHDHVWVCTGIACIQMGSGSAWFGSRRLLLVGREYNQTKPNQTPQAKPIVHRTTKSAYKTNCMQQQFPSPSRRAMSSGELSSDLTPSSRPSTRSCMTMRETHSSPLRFFQKKESGATTRPDTGQTAERSGGGTREIW